MCHYPMRKQGERRHFVVEVAETAHKLFRNNLKEAANVTK